MIDKSHSLFEGRSVIKPCVTAVLLIFLVPAHGSGAEKEDAPASAYSDEDLQGYRESSDNASSVEGTLQGREGQIQKKEKEKKETGKQYWCKQGTRYRVRVVKAKNDVRDTEYEFSEREYEYSRGKISSSRYKTSKSRLEKARSELEKTEQDLSDIENEAHRNWIPPGWLRCQFE